MMTKAPKIDQICIIKELSLAYADSSAQSRPLSCPRATCWQGTKKTRESDGGQFPSHPGRPGPETSSEGAHLTPNPQEIQAGFTPRFNPSNLFSSTTPSFPPSLPSSPRRQKSPVNSKHLYGQGPIRGPPFPEPAQMKF